MRVSAWVPGPVAILLVAQRQHACGCCRGGPLLEVNPVIILAVRCCAGGWREQGLRRRHPVQLWRDGAHGLGKPYTSGTDSMSISLRCRFELG